MLSVVVVDDNPTFRRALGRLLVESGRFEVVGYATDGAEGVQLVAAGAPDLVIMDVSMPVMDGVTAALRIREQHSGVALVLISSLQPHEMPDAVWDCGAIACLAKDQITPDRLERLYRQSGQHGGPGGG